ncbi:MAG: hypothetical protein WA005_15205 [Candidatus Binataceae bacterium]
MSTPTRTATSGRISRPVNSRDPGAENRRTLMIILGVMALLVAVSIVTILIKH